MSQHWTCGSQMDHILPSRKTCLLYFGIATIVGASICRAEAAEDSRQSDHSEPKPEQALEAKREDSPPATLFNSAHVVGGFGGVDVRYTRLCGSDALWVGGTGGVIIDHALTLGLSGGSNVTFLDPRLDPNQIGTGAAQRLRRPNLNISYGGLFIRYHFFSRGVVNVSIGLLAGAGGMSISERADSDGKFVASEAVFVLEPDIGVYLNLTSWMRMGVHGTYRQVAGVSMLGLSNSDFSSLSGGLALQFGKF